MATIVVAELPLAVGTMAIGETRGAAVLVLMEGTAMTDPGEFPLSRQPSFDDQETREPLLT